MLTNLPSTVAEALLIAELYRKRWKIETLFQAITQEFNCEIKTLGYPKAALFSFCMALFAYNIFSTMIAAVRNAQGLPVESNISKYYLAEEVEKTYRGMMIAIPSSDWEIFGKMPLEDFCELLLEWAHHVDIIAFLSSKRGPKKPQPKRTRDPKHTHVSTARLLAKAKKYRV